MVMAVTISSCTKEFQNDPFAIKNYSVSDCKLQGGATKGFDPEYINLRTIDDYYILLDHINSVFNCDPGEITLSIDNSDDTLTIDENESKNGMHCLCPYDIKCTIGPLHYGKYPVVFQKAGVTFKEYSLDFNKSTNIRIDI